MTSMKYDELVKALRCGTNKADKNHNCESGELEAEVDALKHDIERYVQMNMELLNDCSRCVAKMEVQDGQDLMDRINALPTIDAVPVLHGEWIVHTEVKNIYGGICVECPVCGDHFVVLNVSDEKYCRSCGAKMDGGSHDEKGT